MMKILISTWIIAISLPILKYADILSISWFWSFSILILNIAIAILTIGLWIALLKDTKRDEEIYLKFKNEKDLI